MPALAIPVEVVAKRPAAECISRRFPPLPLDETVSNSMPVAIAIATPTALFHLRDPNTPAVSLAAPGRMVALSNFGGADIGLCVPFEAQDCLLVG